MRERIVPSAKQYPLDPLMAAIDAHIAAVPGRVVLLEYYCLDLWAACLCVPVPVALRPLRMFCVSSFGLRQTRRADRQIDRPCCR